MRHVFWFCFARFLHLRLDRSWAIVHPSRKQSQPPPYFAAFLVNCMVTIAVPVLPRWFPISNHCQVSPISFGNCAGNLVCHWSKKPLATFGATSLERQNFQKIWQIVKSASFGQSGKIWSVLHFLGLWVVEFCGNSAAFCGNSAARRFCLAKSLFWPQKTQRMRIWAETLTWILGFSAAILRKILKGQNPSPNGQECIFERFQHASEVFQAFSPLTATNSFVLAAWWIFGVAEQKK